MTRYGDFTLLEDLGKSEVADRFKAMHATLGGPFFLKIYTRLPTARHAELFRRCDALVGKQHPNLAPHLGHGIADGLPFVVSPLLEGVDLDEMANSMLDRRVHLGLETILLVLSDLATAVGAVHAFAQAQDGTPLLVHGDVSIRHVRVGPQGQLWLTGLTTPRDDESGRPPESRWDIAGVGALVYDLVPLLLGGASRPPLPAPLDRVIRRALGIGPVADRLSPTSLDERLREVGQNLGLDPQRAFFADLVQRTVRVLEKKLVEAGGRPRPVSPGRPSAAAAPARRTPADEIPTLAPVDRLERLEPLAPLAPLAPRPPPGPIPLQAGLLELEPLPAGQAVPLEAEATTELRTVESVPSAPPAPRREPPPSATSPATSPPAPPPTIPLPRAISSPPTRPLGAGAEASPRPFSASTVPSLEDAGSPHTDPRSIVLPGTAPRPEMMPPVPPPRPAPPVEAPYPTPGDVFDSGPAPLPATHPTQALGPRPAPPKRSLLADPDEPAPIPTSSSSPLRQDTTDPEHSSPRAERARHDPGLGALLARRVVNQQQAEAAIAEHLRRGGRILEILVAQGATNDGVVAQVLAAAAGRMALPDDALRAREPPADLIRKLPQTYLLARRVLPLSFDGRLLVVAMSDPFDLTTVDELQALVRADAVETVVAARGALTAATLEAYRRLGVGVFAGDKSSARCLLCTHDEATVARIGARLAQEGIQIEHVLHGDAAHEIIATRPPKVVIAAHDLPGQQDVSSLLLFARGKAATAELPFFVLGPRNDEELAARLLDLGADDYLGEPIKIEVLLAKVRRAFGKNRVTLEPAPASAPPAPASLEDHTPVGAIATGTSSLSRPSAPSFLEKLGVPDLEDLPELPPEFEAAPSEAPPAMPTGVMGILRQMSIAEIVQSLEMGRKTARVDVVPAEGDKGSFAFEAGQIRYAECGALLGEEAFFAVTRHKDGFFRIHYGDKPPGVNIEAPTTFLLLEAMRRLDEEGASAGPAA